MTHSRNRGFRYALIVTASQLVSLTAAASPPEVYAIIVGVGNYSDMPLNHAAPDARKMKAHISSVFPGARIDEFVDNAAHQGEVRKALHNIATLSPDSYVIIYFVGHGIREVTGSNNRENLYLLLQGATQKDFISDSINAREIVSAIDSAERIKAMVLVDACFSGVPLTAPEADWLRVGKRAFMIASSAAGQQSMQGYFTDAVFDVWKTAPAGSQCSTPSEFYKSVQEKVYLLSGKLMDSALVFGRPIEMCLADLSGPSTLLVFHFNGAPRPVCNFIYGTKRLKFDPSDAVFDIVVPKRAMEITVRCADFEEKRTFSLADLANPIVEPEPIKLPDPLVDKSDRQYRAKVELGTARALMEYGMSSTDRYLNAAALFVRADPGYSPRAIIEEALIRARPEERQGLRAALGEERLPWVLEGKLKNDSLPRYADTLEALGLYEPAADARAKLFGAASSAKDKSYFGFRAVVNYSAAGDPASAQGIYQTLLTDGLVSKSQKKALTHVINGLSPEEARQTATKYSSALEWQKLASEGLGKR